MRIRDAAFYAIPAAIAVVAGVFAWRAFRQGPEAPPREPPAPALICPAGRFRCAKSEVLATTGVEKPGANPPCDERKVARCAAACVTSAIALDGVDDETAKIQLCDAPAHVEGLIASVATIVELGEDGGACVADGWGPSDDGVLECILRSAKDPDALGLVVARVKCKTPVVRTMDKTPRIVGRDEAIAVWCARSEAVLADAGVSLEAGADADADAADVDADADAGADADADARHD